MREASKTCQEYEDRVHRTVKERLERSPASVASLALIVEDIRMLHIRSSQDEYTDIQEAQDLLDRIDALFFDKDHKVTMDDLWDYSRRNQYTADVEGYVEDLKEHFGEDLAPCLVVRKDEPT